ncbi:sensor histidine kinase [Cellulomonas humilata]|uniref:histidine kinase n=1 Tax=Cellulomonas humilata TaxID=144055 RepID=A0ABU0EK70_9CELL|nr:histidine kinase [Cellulomonas humilata]MDQ0375415.1 signal transduction histidine kinase [Cellulomonas humilata]
MTRPRDVPSPSVLLGLLVGMLALTALAAWAARVDGVPLAVDLALGLLAVATLPLLRSHPLLGGAALGVLAALSPAATPAATAGTYVVARRERLGVAIPVACASIAGHALQALWRSVGLPLGWWLLCDVAVHAALLGWGAYGRTRDALVAQWRERARAAERDQARKVAEARSAERTRIAREMHDTLAHRLTLLATTAGALEYRTDLSAEQVSAAAGVVRASAGEALEELRTVVGMLREGPDELRPTPGLADLPALVEQERAAGATVRLDAPGLDLPTPLGLAVYRTCQEGLTNARRHAPGAPVDVRVLVEDGLRVRVANGTGGRGLGPGTGTGLIGLTERIELLGGTLRAEPVADGFVLDAWIPWAP